MNFKYLGTAAAEAWPALFCQCEACKKAARLGGKNIRRRSGAVVDQKVLIDLPPDLYAHKLLNNLDLGNINHIFITHAHADHFHRETLEMRLPPFAHYKETSMLHLYGSSTVGYEYLDLLKNYPHQHRHFDEYITFHEVFSFKPVKADAYVFTPLPAEHGIPNSFIYMIEHEEKRILYGNDTGYFSESVWDYIKDKYFDMVSLDCTFGPVSSNYTGHMGFDGNFKVRERMMECGIADDKTLFISNHFSHNSGLMHDEIEKLLKPHGFIPSYDGFEVEI